MEYYGKRHRRVETIAITRTIHGPEYWTPRRTIGPHAHMLFSPGKSDFHIREGWCVPDPSQYLPGVLRHSELCSVPIVLFSRLLRRGSVPVSYPAHWRYS